MEERDNLLAFGFSLEYDFKDKEHAKTLYEKYIFSHDFFNTYISLIGKEKVKLEVSSVLSKGLYEVVKYNKYLDLIQDIYRYQGRDGLKRLVPGGISFKNTEQIALFHKKNIAGGNK